MGLYYFKKLPSEITTIILSRLPLRSIGSSKCVCKPWLDVMESPEFVKSFNLRKFAIIKGEKNQYKVVEFKDELHWDTAFDFSFPHSKPTYVSANGLLFLFDHDYETPNDDNYDLSCDYIKLPPSEHRYQHNTFGFGVSRVGGQYKLVRLFRDSKPEVYTLGTGQWRSVGVPDSVSLGFPWRTLGVSCNGNLHWMIRCPDSSSSVKILCFDLETELFSTFSIPNVTRPHGYIGSLSEVGDHLCFRNHFTEHVDIWVMNEYGDDKSWTKEFVIKKHHPCRDFDEHSSKSAEL